jgi:hypothetical protein
MKQTMVIALSIAALIAGIGCRLYTRDPIAVRINKLLHMPSSGPYGNYWLDHSAGKEVRQMGTHAIPYLIRALDENSYISGFDRTVMRMRRVSWIRESWLPMPHWEVQAHIANAFGELGRVRKAAVPLLVVRLTNTATAVLAADALAEIGPAREAVPVLKQARLSTNSALANAAVRALLNIASVQTKFKTIRAGFLSIYRMGLMGDGK